MAEEPMERVESEELAKRIQARAAAWEDLRCVTVAAKLALEEFSEAWIEWAAANSSEAAEVIKR